MVTIQDSYKDHILVSKTGNQMHTKLTKEKQPLVGLLKKNVKIYSM